ncbi:MULTISPECIES: GlxA family transcriptional regulator [unclassified Duganella]|uniref:GlxA family transcriptional regulator n=1 Tax=unclassified Duganella TaxID=2636909 RepID=UPI000E34FB7A|nr:MULTISPECIES: GlxA family transcriptional regulator [unclassified Duganella]RFP10807.1 GlxA family transcriptional regulator [Duganella sp. BJB475]RFP27165.1 GlxA family transcriptional regulator [Duganella sp. BJB476]
MPSKKTLRVVLLAYDDMNLLDLCGPLQALATASKRHTGKGPALYETIVASADGGMITTSAGLPVMTVAIATLDDLAIDTLITPGGCKGQEYYAPPALVKWVVRQAPLVRRLCSVCTGAFLLAAAGQLDGKRATTHWEWVDRLQSQYPGINIDADKIFIQDGSVWSSAGVSAGIDLTLALIEEDYGHHVAIETARQLVMFIKRTGGQSQFSVPLAAQAHEGGRFDDLHAWVAANLHENLTVDRLAEQAGMTPRTFARSYASQSGRTPAKMVEAMRLEAACRALEKTVLPLKAIAANTGYVEEQNLRRVFQRQLGVSPTQYRSRFSGHGAAVN